MGYIDLVAVIVVCVTVIGLYLLERGFLATMRTDAAMHAGNAKAYMDQAASAAAQSLENQIRADQHATRASASAERAATVADLDRKKLEQRVGALEAGRRT